MVASRISISVLACAIGLGGAVAGPIEDTMFAAFEAICIWPINKPDEIGGKLQDIGAMPLDEQTARPMFLNQQPGRAWLIRDKNARLLVTLTDDGVCSVFGPDASGKTVENLVGLHLRTIKLPADKVGAEVASTFAVTYPDPSGGDDLHLVVRAQYSDLTSTPGAALVAIPERLLAKELSRLPPWP